MRLLIDGYNLMHVVNLLPGKKLGHDGLRKARDQFLRRLGDGLGPVESALTTVVFDAADPLVTQSRHTGEYGLTVLFAQDADERIEELIASHPTPRKLTVVSSDLRIRAAARRKKAVVHGSDAFWSQLETRAERLRKAQSRPEQVIETRPPILTKAEASSWEAEFRHVEDMPETHELLAHQKPLLSDEEIARITREVEEEFDGKRER